MHAPADEQQRTEEHESTEHHPVDDEPVEDDKSGGPKEPPAKPKRRWRRRLLIGAGSIPVLLLAGWLAVHNIPGFGPLVADSLRAVFGAGFVAWLEDTAYDVADWFNRKTRGGKAAEPAWEVPAATVSAPAPPATADASGKAATAKPPFTLPDVGPMHGNVATKGEGVWLPLVDPRQPSDRVRLLKTYVHPDKNRSWAIVVVVAVDLAEVDIHAVAGRSEPEARTKEAKSYPRPAVVPAAHRDLLLAAFNGGYKATHGYYGMMVDGVTIAPGRPLACTVAKYRDGRVAIRPWKDVQDTVGDMLWFRQTPVCMYDAGKPHPGLSMPKLGWGASVVSGTTVIRRSAIGIDKEGSRLYVGMGDAVTGRTMAEALVHAGSHWVAQLDVNFSFPKFLTYKHKAGTQELEAVPLTKNFEFAADQYVGSRSTRDFFYLVRKVREP